eukprot:CAMPEP_0178387158 /NCGR_PEP_ID=MMETSP0689_2-20121128/8930_1 /TAXON_ID=160604 /ORGANISM="Amphidinium massartii, Strain CS-259" /LENGTH=592 /DNA_ID=CAMNT_0020007515 /DNA_START=105 /DNA_END=1879 /DNA_ORIENTATION=+
MQRAPQKSGVDVGEDMRIIQEIGSGYDAGKIEQYFKERPLQLFSHALSVGGAIGLLTATALGSTLLLLLRHALSGSLQAPQKEAEWSELRRKLSPQLVDTLCALGPTYVKLGQSLASRPDLVTAEVADALLELQDNMPPFDLDEALQIMREELAEVDDQEAATELLASLSASEPVAAASLGQVYKAHIGAKAVAVKVQRPDVRTLAVADAALLKLLARFAQGIPSWEGLMSWKPPEQGTKDAIQRQLIRADVIGAVDEFCSRLFEELDYNKEAANIERFATLYTGGGPYATKLPYPGVRVPGLLRDFCTRRVLVMEWIDGQRLLAGETSADMRLVDLGVRATLMQLLEVGVMHTDPHGGNLLKAHAEKESKRRFLQPWKVSGLPKDERFQLVYLDFGLVADVPLQVREGLVCAVMYIVQRRWERVAKLFNQLMLLPDWVLADENMLRSFTADVEVAAFAAFSTDAGSGGRIAVPKLRFAALLEQLAYIAPRYAFKLPPYFLNNARALGCLEGMARAADPDFNILSSMYPFALRRLLRNPDASPVLQRTLRDLVSDAEGHLSYRAAKDLLRLAADLQEAPLAMVALDVLRFRA